MRVIEPFLSLKNWTCQKVIERELKVTNSFEILIIYQYICHISFYLLWNFNNKSLDLLFIDIVQIFNIYFRLRFGLGNQYLLKVKNSCYVEEFLTLRSVYNWTFFPTYRKGCTPSQISSVMDSPFKYVSIELFIPNTSVIDFCRSEIFKLEFKTGFWLHYKWLIAF